MKVKTNPMPHITPPPLPQIKDAVSRALQEDLGLKGDITTDSIFNTSTKGTAIIRAREAGILAGHPFAEQTFRDLTQHGEKAKITWHKQDGAKLKPKDKIATISGPVKLILTAERTALNFLGHLSGIASLTGRYTAAIKGTKATIVDTRKTTPGLRAAEKYAVRCGGGENHRLRLDDALLIKDNHIAFAGGISAAIKKARDNAGHMVKLEVEVDTLTQLKECLKHKVDAVLLDNMSLSNLEKAVAMIDGACLAEASGGVTLETVRAIAKTGVDIISVGALTHSAPCLDLGLDIAIS